jgi:signal transduction histidine kinase/ActR/RegA family two-component response regulator
VSRPDTASGQLSGAAERLLGCSTMPLPGVDFGRPGAQDRIEFLLEWMVGVARGTTGVVLLEDGDERLAVRASVGIEPSGLGHRLDGPRDLTFGLIVHGAEIDGEGQPDDRVGAAACAHGLVDVGSRMALCLPLEQNGRLFGAVQIGYAALCSLSPSEVRRISMIADHIASASEAERLARESADRQQEIERISAVLSEIDRLKTDFLSMISHELRTPLTAIIGYTDLLLRQVHGPLTDRQSHHQHSVKKAAHRLLALINDLLDLNRLEGGHVALNRESVSLVDAVRLAVARAAELAEQQGVELRLDAPMSAISVEADPERLHQVLINLLDNAIKFTPRPGTVSVRVDQQDHQVTVSVVDSGVGVPRDQVERIWDRFHQADSSTRRQFGGTGLGLAIVRHLVELHGGSVAVQSEGAGHGSTFSFTVPTGGAVAPRLSPVWSETIGPATEPGISRTVLIVDDEPDNREVISSIVHDVMGHTAITVNNGAEALAAAQSTPDLILLDLRMPGLSGFDVARALKRSPETASIPIIAITALDAEDDRREALEAGCIGCVTKPFAEQSLTSAISNVLAGAGRQVSR